MRPNRRLAASLTRAFVLFGLTIGILNGTLGFLIKDWLELGKAPELTAGTLVRADYRDIPYERVEMAGGTAQILDEHRNVVYERGEPGKRQAYSSEELLRLLEDRESAPDRYTMTTFRTQSDLTYTLLVKMPKQGSYVHVYANLALLTTFVASVWLFGRWTAGRITGPLEQVVQAIRRMRDGHYSERLSFRSDYELAQIQEHFNEMASALERTEREKKEVEEGKQRMLVDLAHDLRTPVTTIQGYAKALQLGMADDPNQTKQYLDIIGRKSEVVAELVEEMFQLATLESPDYPFEAEVGDAAELLRRIAIEFYDSFERKGLVMNVHIPDSAVNVPMNRSLMYRAVTNLLSNALQHNAPGTTVDLSLEPFEGGIRLRIGDDGKGIPEPLRRTIFQPFVKGDSSRRSGAGTGLGLAIAYKAIELHGGELRLVDEPGRTVFEIRLPDAAAASGIRSIS